MRKIERIKGICLGWRNRVGTDIDDAQSKHSDEFSRRSCSCKILAGQNSCTNTFTTLIDIEWANKGYKQPDIHIYWHTIIMLARFLNPITFKGLISLNLSLVDSVIRESQPHTDVLGLPSIALPPEDDYW